MEKLVGIETKYGIIKGRDGIYLDQIEYPNESELILSGEFNLTGEFVQYKIKFYGIIFMSALELDFDQRAAMESFVLVQESKKIKEFSKLDHFGKLNDNHQHYIFRSYDTVFEIVALGFEWQ